MMSRLGRVLLLTIAFGVLGPGGAGAQTLEVYDNFDSGRLVFGNPVYTPDARWQAYEYVLRFADGAPVADSPLTRHRRFSTTNTASRRQIVNGRLQLRLESGGGTYDDPTVPPGHGLIGLTATRRGVNPDRNIVQATVIPIAAEAPACRGTNESRVRAQLVVHLVSTRIGGSAVATLSLERSSFGPDQIVGILTRCRDGQCDDTSITFARTWAIGRSHRLSIRYQPDEDEPENSRVTLTVAGDGGLTEEHVMRNVPSDGNFSSNLGTAFDLRVRTTPAPCPASGDAPAERIAVMMDARFDDVRVGAR